MKLLTCQYEGGARLGVLGDGDQVHLPSLDSAWSGATDMLALIDGGPDAWGELRERFASFPTVALGDVQLMSPIPRPRQNMICLGLNYMDHLRESAHIMQASNKLDPVAPSEVKIEPPEALIAFTKAASCVCGPFDDVPHDSEITRRLDWEVELGVVVGRAGHKIRPEDALDYVFGYTTINDLSARDLQKRHKQFYISKSVPKGGPMGPYIVTADEIPDPQTLRLTCRVNGETMQDSNTAEQIFSVRDALAILSRTPALEAGDIIATGTPAGVGFARQPPQYLTAGDVVECEVEGIGAIRNRIVAPQ